MERPPIPEDYHLHTTFSPDSSQTMPELCQRAIEVGIAEICPTEHYDVIEYTGDAIYFQPDAYFAELERCRAIYGERLTLKAGIEIGEPHRFAAETAALLQRYPFDFVIGSLHWVGDRLVLAHSYFDGRAADEAYGAYFAELLEMVLTGDFDVVGHFDVPKRYGYDLHGPFDHRRHEEVIREILRVCVERGIGLEINHGSLRREVNEPAPTLEVLRWYRELGGEILTIGSDGHRPSAVGDRLELAMAQARAAGFTHLATFTRRQPHFIPLG